MLSILITAHNEGDEVRRTVDSVLSHTGGRVEVVVVDDGSTDGSCSQLANPRVRVIRNSQRTGVAPSRDQAVRYAKGDAFAFLDGHQRVTSGALNRCAAFAKDRSAILFPDNRDFSRNAPVSHGARFELCPQNGYFSARWTSSPPRRQLSRVTSLRAPAYVIPRRVYEQVRWIRGLRSWGGSEAAVSVKAFFLDIPILHLCGTLTHHQYKKKLHYDACWDDVWRNQALIARVCFEERTWQRYWLPQIFADHLTPEARYDLDSEQVTVQHEEFQRHRVRSDAEFWTVLLEQPLPRELR